MGLSKKTFCYSLTISLILVVFIVLYFAFMLPSLYVNNMEKDNLSSVINIQKGYIKNRTYEGLVVKNPTGAATVEIPLQGNVIYLTGKAFHAEVEVKDEFLLNLVEEFRDAIAGSDDYSKVMLPKVDAKELKKILVPGGREDEDYPLSFNMMASKEMEGITASKIKTHVISKNIVVFEGGMTDADNKYTTYIASSKTKDAVIVSFLPVTTPQMKEIRPIVLGSLPMIAAVVVLLVLIGSQIFSRCIVNPVIRLANYAEEVKTAGTREVMPLVITEKDEIGELGSTLNELYARLHEQYRELEDKNQELSRENKRQEVFLRASSHQLKTPITAALLLVDGMIQEVGRYKDAKEYLPEVKRQLKSMQKIVEDILYLNHCTQNMQMEAVDIDALIGKVLAGYKIQMQEKGLNVARYGNMDVVITDREILKKVIDNLVSNAVSYTPPGKDIEIRSDRRILEIVNYGARIHEDIMPHIYEPFVSSCTRQKGRGLGLYVASYYAGILNCSIDIYNIENGVYARLGIDIEDDGRNQDS